ncbi:MAG: hypothetical protein COA69_03300 [Robiginitomaculum sp.]|nr:MAG: hypothetical protein COA69_03300 [Robiginitomaculum sp.]
MQNFSRNKALTYIVGSVFLFGSACTTTKQAVELNELCGSVFDKTLVHDYYFVQDGHATDPMAIPSHDNKIVESKIVSSFSHEIAIGTYATPARFETVWKSVDTWGETTPIKVVVTVDGWHAFSFPSDVPTTRKEDHADGFYDVFANGGAGLRGHINPELVSMIYAVKLRASDDTYQRSLSFYGHGGDLILGLYASEGGKPQNADAIAGFNRSWNVIKAMPRSCKE